VIVPTPAPPATWPPIIGNAAVPRTILWRDRLITIAMWFLLLWSCRGGLRRLWDAAGKLLQNDDLAIVWAPGWAYLRHHFTLVGLLALWLIFWTMVTLWRRRRHMHVPQPPALTLEEQADMMSSAPADLAAWRELKVCIVDLDAQGHVSVAPGQARAS
jgi:poly-beta-1,6-N-acetyl-D-glucosamine biosynthesis protein PgaD